VWACLCVVRLARLAKRLQSLKCFGDTLHLALVGVSMMHPRAKTKRLMCRQRLRRWTDSEMGGGPRCNTATPPLVEIITVDKNSARWCVPICTETSLVNTFTEKRMS